MHREATGLRLTLLRSVGFSHACSHTGVFTPFQVSPSDRFVPQVVFRKIRPPCPPPDTKEQFYYMSLLHALAKNKQYKDQVRMLKAHLALLRAKSKRHQPYLSFGQKRNATDPVSGDTPNRVSYRFDRLEEIGHTMTWEDANKLAKEKDGHLLTMLGVKVLLVRIIYPGSSDQWVPTRRTKEEG